MHLVNALAVAHDHQILPSYWRPRGALLLAILLLHAQLCLQGGRTPCQVQFQCLAVRGASSMCSLHATNTDSVRLWASQQGPALPQPCLQSSTAACQIQGQ